MVSLLQNCTFKTSLSKFSLMHTNAINLKHSKLYFFFSPQEFKAIVLCFAFFVVAASGASVCECPEEEKKVK